MTTTAAAPPKRREKGSSRRHTVHVVQKSGSETEDDDTIFRNASYYEDMNSSDTYKNTSDTEPETSPLDTVYYDEEKELDAFIGQLGISSTDNSNDETYAQERRAETAKRKYKPRKKTQETTILEPLKTTGKRRRRSSEKNAVSLPAQELAVEALPIEAVQEPPTPTPPPLQPPKVLCINFFDKTDYKSVQPPQLQQSNALQVQQPQQPQDITQQKEKEQQQQQPNKEEVDEKQEQKQSSPLPPPPQLQQQLQQKGLLTLRLPITCQTTPLLLSQTNSSQSVPQILTAIQSGATQFTPPSEKLQVSSAKFPTLQEKTILSYFPYVDPSLKEHEVERFLSRRTCLDTRTRKDGRQYHEFLTKYTGLSYRRCKWVPGDLFKPGTKAYTQLKMFETKWEKNLERSVSVENVIDVQKRATCSGYDESVVEFITPETILLSVSDPQKLFNDPHLPQTELYLVKWSGLRPLESTWETKESLCDDALIQWYKETEMAFDRKKHGWKKEDIMFERLQRYQTVGVAWAFKCYAEYKRNIILGDEFGLGKRVQAIFTLVNISKEVMRVGGHMPIFLIVTSTDIMENWLEEIQLYTSLKAISCYGNLDERTVVKSK